MLHPAEMRAIAPIICFLVNCPFIPGCVTGCALNSASNCFRLLPKSYLVSFESFAWCWAWRSISDMMRVKAVRPPCLKRLKASCWHFGKVLIWIHFAFFYYAIARKPKHQTVGWTARQISVKRCEVTVVERLALSLFNSTSHRYRYCRYFKIMKKLFYHRQQCHMNSACVEFL